MPTPTPNLQVTPPETLGALQSQLVNALAADEAVNVTTVSGGTQVIQGARLALKALPAVAAPTIANGTAGGGTSYSYKVVAKMGSDPAPVSAVGTTATGASTLTAINSNIVTFTCVPYATSYDIYRSASSGTPSTTGLIGNVLQPAAVIAAFPTSASYQTTAVTATFIDTGIAGDGSTAPTTNLTGSIQADFHNDINVVALSAPFNLAVGQLGTAATTHYSYVVSAGNSVGEAPCTAVQTTAGAATLTGTNSNLITWNSTPSAQYYNVYRSASSGTPGTTGLIGTVYPSGAASYSLNDTGITVITTFVPTANTTGSIKTAGLVLSGGLIVGGPTLPANTTASGGSTYTVAQMLAPVLLRSGGAGQTDTTPTAQAIVAGISGAVAGMGWVWTVRNALTGTCTLGQAATGITWAAGNTNTVATISSHTFYILITNATPGSEAITIYSLTGSVAY